MRVSRSQLTMPVNVPRFVERAWSRGADLLVLDLEDSVAPDAKLAARGMVKDAIPVAARGGSSVGVRINHDTWMADLEAAVWPGLSSVAFPKAETADEVRAVAERLSDLERERGMPVGGVRLRCGIETPLGVWNAHEIAAASERIEDVGGVSDADLTGELGVRIEMLREMDVLSWSRGESDLAARAAGRFPGGRVWARSSTVADYGDEAGLYASYKVSADAGFRGAFGIHPTQTAAQNRAFTPSQADVALAGEVVAAFEAGWARGEAAAAVRGRVVDARVAAMARDFVEFAAACAETDARKARMRAEMEARERR